MILYQAERSQYFNKNIEYLFNSEIIEYDMEAASLSLIIEYKLLPENEIRRLSDLPKMERNITVGKLQRDIPGFSDALMSKFALARKEFIEQNDLDDDNILAVKRDAIFTIGECNKHTFGNISFIPKSAYSSYIRFTNNSNIEIYYSSKELDIKGIGEIGLSRHRLYMLDFLSKVIGYIETKNPSVKRFMKSFIDRYKSMELDEGYYIEFNNLSSKIDPIFNYQKVIIPILQLVVKEVLQ